MKSVAAGLAYNNRGENRHIRARSSTRRHGCVWTPRQSKYHGMTSAARSAASGGENGSGMAHHSMSNQNPGHNLISIAAAAASRMRRASRGSCAALLPAPASAYAGCGARAHSGAYAHASCAHFFRLRICWRFWRAANQARMRGMAA